MVPKGKAATVDNTARRTWDKEEFKHKAQEREDKAKARDKEEVMDARRRKRLERDPLHQGLIVERSSLKQREYQIDLQSRLGKTQVVGLNTPLNQQAGYFCSVCDCILRDSQSYLDHINGKWHNRALGMTMKVEKVSVDQIKTKLEEVKRKKEAYNPDDYLPDGFDRRIIEAEEAEERAKEERREKKKERRREKERLAEAGEGEGEGMDPDMMVLMGFGGFGTSSKNK